jgi:hypothetical protein
MEAISINEVFHYSSGEAVRDLGVSGSQNF